MSEPDEVKFDVDTEGKNCVFMKYRAHNEKFCDMNTPLLEYQYNGSKKIFKNPKKGVLRMNAAAFKNGTPLAKGDVVAWWIGHCKHDVIFGDTCAACLMSMVGTGFMEAKERGDAQYVSKVHNVTSLLVQLDTAKKLANDHHNQLLSKKKLILLIDLDQTLIHTTNRPPKANEKQDIHTFKLFNIFYHTKVRPHTYKLLDKMSKLFELHVVTYGQRSYAEQIVRLLDPEKTYFSNRILTRNELISSNSKSVNLQAIFPSGPQLVLMIDDRPDVWENSDALVWIKPYRYFTEVGDINDINSARGSDSPIDEETTTTTEQDNPSTSFTEPRNATANGNASIESDQAPSTSNAQPSSQAIVAKIDTDDVLENVEHILTEIHTKFFENYNKDQEITPVREFAADIRKKVLEDEVIVFSGVVRQGTDMTINPLYQCCIRFGATVQDEITDQTTTLIAGKAQTEKYHTAKKRNIPIVTPRWIEECMAYWKKVDKSKFVLQLTTEYEYAMNKGLSHMNRLSRDDLSRMQDEVDEELAGMTSEEDDDNDLDEPEKKKQKV